MASLVPTLHTHLRRADDLWASGRTGQARKAFEELLQAAQERSDRAMEVVARSMLARMALRLHAIDEARGLLSAAGRTADPHHLDAYRRYRASLVRLAVEEGPPAVAREEAARYLRWADEAQQGAEVLDACLLLADLVAAGERIAWLQRGIEQARALGAEARLGEAYTVLAAALEQDDQAQEALEAYAEAYRWHEALGHRRATVASAWAVGATALRLEDWARARDALQTARRGAEAADDCDDLLALLLADLATVEAAAGDVVEARRLMLVALERGEQQGLAALWPARWEAVRRQARELEVL